MELIARTDLAVRLEWFTVLVPLLQLAWALLLHSCHSDHTRNIQRSQERRCNLVLIPLLKNKTGSHHAIEFDFPRVKWVRMGRIFPLFDILCGHRQSVETTGQRVRISTVHTIRSTIEVGFNYLPATISCNHFTLSIHLADIEHHKTAPRRHWLLMDHIPCSKLLTRD